MMKKGAWAKYSGGDAGAFWDGKRWRRFECIGCMFAKGFLNPKDRISMGSAASYPTLRRVLREGIVEFPHDVIAHNNWVRSGKHIVKGVIPSR